MLRPDIRKALSRASVERLQPAFVAYAQEKRNFSQLSSASLGPPSKQANFRQEIDDETNMKYHLQVNKRAHAKNWSYIELLASRLKEPSKATLTMKNPRNLDQQARWRKAIMKAYSSEKAIGQSVLAWCPIAQGYNRSITAAYIIRFNVEYKEMLDNAKIDIISTKDSKDLIVIVFNEDERVQEPEPSELTPAAGRALYRRTLKFLTNHRPSMRYLYFAFTINLIRREKFKVHRWKKDRLEYADTPFFPTPGNWIRETTLRKLAMRIGHMPVQEAGEFVSTRGIYLEDPFLQGKNEEEDEEDGKDGEDEGDGKDGEDEEKDEVFTSILQYAYQN
ncbi:hypothetical protein CIB48_g3288 [Xylaria polymorpha]|nr:hypothetical protein CIB48_g3288 [Xylaria polymorpha]